MRNPMLLALAVLSHLVVAERANAAAFDLTYITQYCNETIQTADLSTDPRMLRNIQNSLMTAAPSYLDESIYLQRRSNMVNLCPELDGIGEISAEWLRSDRVSVSEPAVIIAAVPETFYPGAGALLTALGWTAIGNTITLDYFDGAENIPLYAGLIPAGEVQVSGSGVNPLRDGGNEVTASQHFFFQDAAAMPPEVLAELQVVAVPEPGMAVLLGTGALVLLVGRRIRRARIFRRQ